MKLISIHALREEGDHGSTFPTTTQLEFLSTPSARRATYSADPSSTDSSNFYPRPPRGGRLATLLRIAKAQNISIHALREEGDRNSWLCKLPPRFLSTPSARRATFEVDELDCNQLFLSTPSARRATVRVLPQPISKRFLSTPSARRATHSDQRKGQVRSISIHALREEGDPGRSKRDKLRIISIHALREEGDATLLRIAKAQNISIHALREEGDGTDGRIGMYVEISIHALREEGDPG